MVISTEFTKGRNICWTIFGDWTPITALPERVRYVVWQREMCPTSGREHYQGYMETTAPFTKGMCRTALACPSVHLEKRTKTREQARNYCMKPETRLVPEEVPLEFGEWQISPGSRSDLDTITSFVTEGGSLTELAEAIPEAIVRYSRGVTTLINLRDAKKAKKADRNITVNVIWGAAGIGKTRYAAQVSRDFYIVDAPSNGTMWYDGYEGEEHIILDDFYGWVKHSTLLRLLDRYPFKCTVKGGFKWANWTTVWITSNKHPREWYDGIGTNWTWDTDLALQRRISNLYEMKESIFGVILHNEKGEDINLDKDFIIIN